MRVLITGMAGFVGSHLAEYCVGQGDTVFGTVKSPNSRLDNLSPRLLAEVTLIECELTDYKNVLDTIKEAQPDVIFHLAAQSFVPTSWKSPADTIVNNSVAQINIFEAIRELKINPVIQIACTSEEYGLVYENEVPIKETNPLRPLSPYGVSKITQEMLAYQYHQSYGLKTVITRAFNHEGPRRGVQFVTSAFAKQLSDLPAEGGTIKVGNLDSYRDFTDVRDMVRAYYLAVTSPDIEMGGVYNLCSGKSWKISAVLDYLIILSGKEVTVEHDPSRDRPSDVPVLKGDYKKFRDATGWIPGIPFEKTLKDIYEYFEEQKNG